MACNRKTTYYVVSKDNKLCYGFNKLGTCSIIDNLPWSKPYLFHGVKQARKIADKLGYTVRYYPGKRKVNRTSDNQ